MSNLQDDELDHLLGPTESAEFGLNDQIEYEDLSGDEVIISPFDPTQIRIETKVMTIDLLRARMDAEELDMAPDFQRQAGIWKDDAQSRLVESILIRIPLPAFYMDATNDDKWVVVDGLQRLTALRRFIIHKELKLRGLEFLHPIEGRSYDELPRNFQRRILETQVTVYLIAKGTPEQVKFNIFKRINTGGLPLSSQEIRHALNQGKVTTLLNDLAKSAEFKRATDSSVSNDRMADREFVLRFLAFSLTPYTDYVKPDFDDFLNRTMQRINNELSDKEIAALGASFRRSMQAAADIFENAAFRKRYKLNGRRGLINKPLFDTWSFNLSQCSDAELKQLKRKKEVVRRKFTDLLNNERDFDNAISQGTGDVGKVRLRFSRINQLIKEVLND